MSDVELQNDHDENEETGNGPAPGKPADDKPDTDAWEPPSRAEFEKLKRDLAAANRESRTRREKLAELTKASEDADGKKAREQAEAAEARYKPVAVRAAAKAAFLEAGLSSADGVTKLVRMLDLDTIEVGDDGDITGLDEQVAELKTDFPALFATPRTRAPRLDTGSRPGPTNTAKSSAERIAAQVLGGAA